MKYEIHCCEAAIESLDLRAQISRHNLWSPEEIDEKDEKEERKSEMKEAMTEIQMKQENYLKDLERLQLCIQVRLSCLLSLSSSHLFLSPLSLCLSVSLSLSLSFSLLISPLSPLSLCLSHLSLSSICGPPIAIVCIVEMISRVGMICLRTVLGHSKRTTSRLMIDHDDGTRTTIGSK
jgi:hypothetical protein